MEHVTQHYPFSGKYLYICIIATVSLGRVPLWLGTSAVCNSYEEFCLHPLSEKEFGSAYLLCCNHHI